MTETGHISISTDNILPIIKKWLYSEKDIYLRELVANSVDAITKLEKLNLLGEAQDIPEAKICISIDKDKKILEIRDSGLGMSADEIKKYINDVAFSGVKDFVEKYQGKDEESQIIGHFGLGFYSAFMVATKVEIDSLSYRPDSKPVHWVCEGDTGFVMKEGERKEIGTTIRLHVGADSEEMLDKNKIYEILNKFCAFMKYPIELEGQQINDTKPLWTKSPSEVKEEDYKEFFQRVFPMASEPMFWIHLNVDYPFKLRGILYFPKLKSEYDAAQGEIKLFCNQVFVADNSKELIPEYLTVLKGVIDCPDLPLNVSRSYLQNDPYARKISEHITKKVCDKLSGMEKTDRENYEKHWPSINGFIKYGMLRDPKFFDRMKDHVIYKNAEDKYLKISDYLEKNKDKTDNKVIYASDPVAQSSLLKMFKDEGVDVIIADSMLDKHFMPYFEMQSSAEFKFVRIDSEVIGSLKHSEGESQIVDPKDNLKSSEKIAKIFTDRLKKDGLEIEVENLKSQEVPAILITDESQRRLAEMAEVMPGASFMTGFADNKKKLIVNANCPAVKSLITMSEHSERLGEVELIVQQVYDLAYLQHGEFNAKDMQSFIHRSVDLLGRLGAR